MDRDDRLAEMRRQNAVDLYGLAGTQRESLDTRELGAIALTLQQFLGTDYAGVHILDEDLLVPLAASLQPPPAPEPRPQALCSVVMTHYDDADLLEIPDAHQHRWLRDNPSVNGTRRTVRFYAAAALRTETGLTLGTLCAWGHAPRTLNDSERRLLRHLGYAALHVLDRRRRQGQAS